MTRGETIIAATTAGVIYLASPSDVLSKVQTILFLAFLFMAATCVIWAVEELDYRIRRARRISRRKRKVVNIDFGRTGLIDENGREVRMS